MKYKILSYYNHQVLEDKVNAFIQAGWKPQGGLQVVLRPDRHEIIYWQAMIKENDSSTD